MPSHPGAKRPAEQLYALIANEEDARSCTDLPEDACREVPRNFFLILASNVLTKIGDLLISPKTVLAWLLNAVGAPALVAFTALLAGEAFGGTWLYPVAFFVLSIAHAGVRLGRKTYLVDMAGGNKRTDYTSVSNSVIGLLLLAVGGLTALLSLVSNIAVILVLGLMGLAGALSARGLKEVSGNAG